jgi:hypothetical protein
MSEDPDRDEAGVVMGVGRFERGQHVGDDPVLVRAVVGEGPPADSLIPQRTV